MTNRECEFAALGIEYAEGIECAAVVAVPSTGREVRRIPQGWEVQPWNDNCWVVFPDLLDAIRFGSRPPPPGQRYILNAAVITAAGRWDYQLITPDEAIAWLGAGEYVSTVGYPETARALTVLTGAEVQVNRRTIRMNAGDEALVFRLVLPPGAARIDPHVKGQLTVAWISAHCEIGILVRVR